MTETTTATFSKEEALKALSEGKRLTHDYFGFGEFIQQVGGFYCDEMGYQLGIEEFWHYRRNAAFDHGWSIYVG